MSAAPAMRPRAVLRFALGRPGSWRRWVVGSLAWLLAAAALATATGWYWLLVLAVLPVLAALAWRPNVVGDEDELRAGFFGEVMDAVRGRTQEDPEGAAVREAPAEPVDVRPDGYEDVPLPPIAEEPVE